MHFMTSHKHIVDILIPITTSHNCNIDIWNYNCDYPKLYLWICNSPGSTLPQLVGAGLEPGIPVREAGALTRNAKGYSL